MVVEEDRKIGKKLFVAFLILIIITIVVYFPLFYTPEKEFTKDYCISLFTNRHKELKGIELEAVKGKPLFLYKGKKGKYEMSIFYRGDTIDSGLRECRLVFDSNKKYEDVFKCNNKIISVSIGKTKNYLYAHINSDGRSFEHFYNTKYTEKYSEYQENYETLKKRCEEIG